MRKGDIVSAGVTKLKQKLGYTRQASIIDVGDARPDRRLHSFQCIYVQLVLTNRQEMV
jgi:hypothetical protein